VDELELIRECIFTYVDSFLLFIKCYMKLFYWQVFGVLVLAACCSNFSPRFMAELQGDSEVFVIVSLVESEEINTHQ